MNRNREKCEFIATGVFMVSPPSAVDSRERNFEIALQFSAWIFWRSRSETTSKCKMWNRVDSRFVIGSRILYSDRIRVPSRAFRSSPEVFLVVKVTSFAGQQRVRMYRREARFLHLIASCATQWARHWLLSGRVWHERAPRGRKFAGVVNLCGGFYPPISSPPGNKYESPARGLPVSARTEPSRDAVPATTSGGTPASPIRPDFRGELKSSALRRCDPTCTRERRRVPTRSPPSPRSSFVTRNFPGDVCGDASRVSRRKGIFSVSPVWVRYFFPLTLSIVAQSSLPPFTRMTFRDFGSPKFAIGGAVLKQTSNVVW